MEDELKQFYHKHLEKFGPSAQGVGWKNREAQTIRFEQLAKVFNRGGSLTINDLGCGVGDFVSFVDALHSGSIYIGYDVMPEMIRQAREKFKDRDEVQFELIKDAGEMRSADYTIASGIFNIRFQKDDASWLQYILATIHTMNEKSATGFAFNVLTKYSDKEFMKQELYYADPTFLFDYCKVNFSKNVALLHDYNQFDFTIIVRKQF